MGRRPAHLGGGGGKRWDRGRFHARRRSGVSYRLEQVGLGCGELEDLVCGVIIVGKVEEDVEGVFVLRISRVHSGDVTVFDERWVLIG